MFVELFHRLNIIFADSSLLTDCWIKKIVHKKNNEEVVFHIQSNAPVSLEILNNAVKLIGNKMGLGDKVNLTFTNVTPVVEKDLLQENYFKENMLYTLSIVYPSGATQNDSFIWRFENHLLRIVLNDPILSQKAEERRVAEIISRMIKSVYGINIRCQFEKDELKSFNPKSYTEKKNLLENRLIEEALVSNSDFNGVTEKKPASSKTKNSNNSKQAWVGKVFNSQIHKIGEISEEDSSVTVAGEIFAIDIRVLKNNRKLYILDITDYTGSITLKLFEPRKKLVELEENLHVGVSVAVRGTLQFDHYNKENILMISDLMPYHFVEEQDKAHTKRIEFHCHTNMSQMDGVCSPSKIIKQAAKWGHQAIAITDHGVVQAFPEAAEAGKKHNIRILYGVEGYLVDDETKIVRGNEDRTFNDTFVVFDIETTGLSSAHDQITEIGAIKIEQGEIVSEFSQLINPGVNITTEISELTGITNEMVASAPPIENVLPKFIDFCEEAVLVAHNANFDIGFIRENLRKMNKPFTFSVIDTLTLSRILLKELKRHKLNLVAKALGINLENHHRAVHDARATAEIFLHLVKLMKNKDIHTFRDMNIKLGLDVDITKLKPYHFIAIAKNKTGLRNLYELISTSHLEYFYKKPRIPKSLLRSKKEGLLLGTACQAGELYQAILNRETDEKIKEITGFYDYLEVQPVANNLFLIEKRLVKNREELQEINRTIVSLGEVLNKPVLATGDTHYASSTDNAFRKILQTGMGYDDAEDVAELFLKTTDDMLLEFSYLGSEKADEIVVANPGKLMDEIEEMLPVPEGTFPPYIEGSEEQLEKLCREKAELIYGDPLPEIVSKRLERELRSIIDNGYAVMYMIAHKLVAKSLSDGYLVGSRGSVGSSFAATMSDITEVNPLPPHYICTNCKHSEFFTEGQVESGVDLPNAVCPICGENYKKDGHQIPFEVFLGFEGDKEPDIDLNFAGEYQSEAHQYVEFLFGKSKVFRAGTIGTIAQKTAYGYVKKYGEEKALQHNNAEIKRLTEGCTGVKKTSGQHPGGVMIVPSDKDIHEFTPIQYPANDSKSGVVTTHFDYHALSGRLLKLDILGHDVPTMIRMLEDFTGTNALDIPLDDAKTKSIFIDSSALELKDDRFQSELGSIAIPEFGTRFVRQMLQDTQPSTFGELVRISGLSHGTDVWLNNAQELVHKKTATLKEVICTRDDIMNYLILKGLPAKDSFKIMEKVRKGKGITEEEVALMRENDIPQWYIDSCNKIKYMFPKAHAVAYVMMSFRIAWFKVYYPEAFYATYFSMKVDDFDAQLMIQGMDAIHDRVKQLEAQGNEVTAKEKNLLIVLEVALEMFSRGIKIHPVDLYHSHAEQFLVGVQLIRPPLSSLQGVGQNVARRIAEERDKSEFLSLEDLRQRTGASKTVIETLKNHGACQHLPETNQLSLFNLAVES